MTNAELTAALSAAKKATKAAEDETAAVLLMTEKVVEGAEEAAVDCLARVEKAESLVVEASDKERVLIESLDLAQAHLRTARTRAYDLEGRLQLLCSGAVEGYRLTAPGVRAIEEYVLK